MSAPRTDYVDPIEGARIELISAMSALNMEPSPIEHPIGPYLSDRDEWARHAYEHIIVAFGLLERVRKH